MKRIDNKVKVCFISAYDVEYAALGEQFPSLERDGIPNKIIRKLIEVTHCKNRARIININKLKISTD
jgi:hypothetical protein